MQKIKFKHNDQEMWGIVLWNYSENNNTVFAVKLEESEEVVHVFPRSVTGYKEIFDHGIACTAPIVDGNEGDFAIYDYKEQKWFSGESYDMRREGMSRIELTENKSEAVRFVYKSDAEQTLEELSEVYNNSFLKVEVIES